MGWSGSAADAESGLLRIQSSVCCYPFATCSVQSLLQCCDRYADALPLVDQAISQREREREDVRKKHQPELHVGRGFGLTFSQALLLEPNRPELHLGCSMPVMLVVLETIKLFLRSISSHAHVRRGQCLMQLDKLEDALTSFEAAVLPAYFLKNTHTHTHTVSNSEDQSNLFQSVCPGCPSAGFTMHLCTAKQGTTLLRFLRSFAFPAESFKSAD